MAAVNRVKESMLSHAELLRLLHYDPETGIFTWRVRAAQRVHIGDVAGSLNRGTGYRSIALNGNRFLEHRLAWLYMTGEWPKNQVDHKNLKRDDNRWSNLRAATGSQNKGNQRKQKDHRGNHKGAYIDARGGRHFSKIIHNGVRHYLGRFDSEIEAHEAYCRKAKELHGEFARS